MLKEKGFIKSEAGFKIAYFKTNGIGITATTCVDCFTPGAYKISKSMTAWQVAETFKEGPYMKWVVIPEGLRKEQIADILANQLGWNEDAEKKWVTTYTSMNYDEIEGLYFPDTYLIPVDEEPLKVADRLRTKFNEKFQPYTQEALKQNIKWTTALKLASIVQREAAGKDDMPLIAGISFEVIRFAGKMRSSKLINLLLWPGLMSQYLTTRVPDDSMIEVALAALRAVVEADAQAESGPDSGSGLAAAAAG